MPIEVGLISDTHGFLDPQVAKAFADVDEIWHAGDFGNLEVATQLEQLKPLRGVFGNIDDLEIRNEYPEDSQFECEGVSVWMTHIAGRPGFYHSRVRKKLKKSPPDLLICGHSHICHVQRDKDIQDMLYLNPGAAGHAGAHVMRTLLKFQIFEGQVQNLRVVELGPRGRMSTGSGQS